MSCPWFQLPLFVETLLDLMGDACSPSCAQAGLGAGFGPHESPQISQHYKHRAVV